MNVEWNVKMKLETEINNRGKYHWIVIKYNSKKYYELWKLLLAETFLCCFEYRQRF